MPTSRYRCPRWPSREATRVLVEQTGAVDVSRLGDYRGHLTVEEQWGFDLALETVLDLQK